MIFVLDSLSVLKGKINLINSTRSHSTPSLVALESIGSEITGIILFLKGANGEKEHAKILIQVVNNNISQLLCFILRCT